MVDLHSGKLPRHLRIHLVKTENIQKLLQTACFALNSLQFFLCFKMFQAIFSPDSALRTTPTSSVTMPARMLVEPIHTEITKKQTKA